MSVTLSLLPLMMVPAELKGAMLFLSPFMLLIICHNSLCNFLLHLIKEVVIVM